ncbi:MAG: GFA family protein [Pseudomonadota bacterium]
MIRGGCLCGRVRYSYDGDIDEISLCHCRQCQKAQGTAFAAVSPLDTRRLSFEGTEHIREYPSSEHKVRAFCSHCGSPLYSARSDLPNIRRLRVGTIDDQTSGRNIYHIHTASKPDWDIICDNHPQYSGKLTEG